MLFCFHDELVSIGARAVYTDIEHLAMYMSGIIQDLHFTSRSRVSPAGLYTVL